MKQTEFGTGLVYNLGLFLAHQDRFYDKRNETRNAKDNMYPSMWFNGAGDHIIDLMIPKTLPVILQKRLKIFVDKVMEFRHSLDLYKATEKDIEWCLEEAKNLLIELDKQLGVKAVKGEFE